LLVGGRRFVEIYDAAPDRRIELAHGVEHAGIIEPIRARLDKDKALKTNAPRDLEVSLERLVRRLVAQVGAVGVTVRRAEHVEMRVTSMLRNGKSRLDAGVWILRHHTQVIHNRSPKLFCDEFDPYSVRSRESGNPGATSAFTRVFNAL